MRHTLIITALAVIALLSSCGSTKDVAALKTSEVINNISDVEKSVTSDSVAHTTLVTARADSSMSLQTENIVTEDSSSIVTINETTYYDTSRLDSLGKPLVAKVEKNTRIERSGHKEAHGLNNSAMTHKEENAVVEKSVQGIVRSELTASNKEERHIKNETKATRSTSESKQTKYIAMVLYGVAGVILMGIIAYVVFMAYRARDHP